MQTNTIQTNAQKVVTDYINASTSLQSEAAKHDPVSASRKYKRSTEKIEHATQELLRTRNILLGYVLKLKRTIDAQHTDLQQALSQRLRETLTDYVSYGHFCFLPACEPAAHLQAAMQANTSELLRLLDHEQTNRLDLENFAWQLDTRFEIEDDIFHATF